jgi:ABC-type hemin transport system ATPase subunit
MKKTLLQARSLCIGSHGKPFLNSVNFVICSGETVVLVGTQDSGRQHLFRFICGEGELLSGS